MGDLALLETPGSCVSVALSPDATDAELNEKTLKIGASAGVVCFHAPDGRTVLIATTADARGLVRRRLGLGVELGQSAGSGDSPASKPGGVRVDMRSIVGRVDVMPVGSALEADAVYVGVVRRELPTAYRAVTERWRAWFAQVDPGAHTPAWSKTNLVGSARPRSAGGGASGAAGADIEATAGVLLGPIPDKDAAGRFIEGVIDAFDLCRFPNVLAQAPRGTACAYKEMGRCPSPCDGTESMESYRERTTRAVELVSAGGVGRAREALDVQMRELGARGEFEEAGRVQKLAQRLKVIDAPGLQRVRRLDAWSLVMVLPAAGGSAALIAALVGGRLVRVGEVGTHEVKARSGPIASEIKSLVRTRADWRTCEHAIDTFGLVSRWLGLPEKKRRGVVIEPVDGRVDAGQMAKAMTTVLKKHADIAEVSDQETQVS